MSFRPIRYPVVAMAAAAVALIAASVSAAGSSSSIQVISDSQLQAMTTTVGGVAGAPSLNTGNTVAHWFGTTANPNDGITYGYNMVGADPSTDGSVTVEADVQPLIVHVAGLTFDGTQVMAGTLNSPLFTLNDYGSTAAAT